MIVNHMRVVTKLHDQGCQCVDCEPPVPSIPTALSGDHIGLLALAGFATATVIAAAYDLHGTIAALRAVLPW